MADNNFKMTHRASEAIAYKSFETRQTILNIWKKNMDFKMLNNLGFLKFLGTATVARWLLKC